MTDVLHMVKVKVDMCHNPALVVPDASPNDNTIYHLYPDGEIHYQKGGFAYLKRSVFIEEHPVRSLGNTFDEAFPIVREGDYGRYAIVTREDALEIRALMLSGK